MFMFDVKMLKLMKKCEKKWKNEVLRDPLQKPGFWPIFWGSKKGVKKSIFFVIFYEKMTYGLRDLRIGGGHRSPQILKKNFYFCPAIFGGCTAPGKSILRDPILDRDHMGICITCTDSPIT